MTFTNKNILLVGGSAGIGFALAEQLSANGANVYNLSRNSAQWSGQVQHHAYDVTAETTPLPDNFLPAELHGLVYCVGNIRLAPFTRLSAKDFLSDYTLHVVGAVTIIQKAMPSLKRAGAASIVLISSVAATAGMAFHASTGTAKAAVEGLVLSLAAELAPQRIRVNAVAPSLTDTAMASQLLNTPEKQAAAAKRHPMGRYGTAADTAHVAAFLLSDESSWLTAQIIGADGGMGKLRG